jgi:hypothetical protein
VSAAGRLTLQDLVERVITDGIEAATRDYADDRPKREGAIAGFEACRGLDLDGLRALLTEARERGVALHCAGADPENYWYARCYELEVEWVANVVSGALLGTGMPLIIPPTVRGVTKAAEILGVRGA